MATREGNGEDVIMRHASPKPQPQAEPQHQPLPRRLAPPALFVLLVVLIFLAGCSRTAPSTLDSVGFGARRVEGLWWLLFWISVAVFVEVMLLLAWALLFRRDPGTRIQRRDPVKLVAVAGAAVPVVILLTVYGIGLRDLAALGVPERTTAPTVDVIGHKWWWEVRYEGVGGATANEIHVPVGQVVHFRLTTADVNHSFWVPQLMPKTDLISGETRETWIRAERAGEYRGQCAEYCGTQHGHMAFLVIAEPRAEFDAWLGRLGAPAPEPANDAQRRGQAAFLQGACAACHTIRGTSAGGTVGPDLTAVGARWSLGAGAVPNAPGYLGGWIANSQSIKPGNGMPPQPVDAARLPDLIAYLESLR
jgi:cytochrome c oxidase subunit 2